MAFRRCINKWRFFKTKSSVSVLNLGKMFLCATILHNYCINEHPEEHRFDPHDDGTPALPQEYYQQPRVRNTRGCSYLRSIIVNRIQDNNLERPSHNIERNSRR